LGTSIIELKLDEMAASCYGKEQSSFHELLQEQYPTYLTWLKRVYYNLTRKGDLEEILFYLDKVLEVYTELRKRHPAKCLLHGDLHQENMLLNSDNGYTIIDPKGVVDAPVLETARFLRNETLSRDGKILGEEDKIREMVAIISPMIGILEEDLLRSLFIDTALSCSWILEENFSTEKAFEDAKQKALEACEFAYGLLSL
jgi:streptomycin 6-kinase